MDGDDASHLTATNSCARPRSKSESKSRGRTTNLLTTIKNSMQMLANRAQASTSPTSHQMMLSARDHQEIHDDCSSTSPTSGTGESGSSGNATSGSSSRQRSYSSSANAAGPVHKGVMDLIRSQRSHSIPNSFGSCSSFQENINQIYVRFFSKYHCYDLVPVSAKLVVFDTQLLVKKAFQALVNNGCKAAPLWDSGAQQFVGMLSVTDFINIIRTYHKSPTIKIEDVEDQKIEVWRKLLIKEPKPLVSIGPDACLLDAILTLTQNKVHRLPIIDPDTGNVLYILTHKRILKFLFLFYHELPQPSYLFRTLRELKVGSYDNICTTTRASLVITALDKFIERRVSALPVVDEKSGKVVDIFSKHDAINMAAEKTYNNLSLTVGQAIERHSDWFEGVVKCKVDETLGTIIHRIVKAEVHRIVVVDSDDKVTGIVSLSDILTFLAIRPLDRSNKDVNLAEEPFESDGDLVGDDEPFS